jgi:hypothetical protein
VNLIVPLFASMLLRVPAGGGLATESTVKSAWISSRPVQAARKVIVLQRAGFPACVGMTQVVLDELVKMISSWSLGNLSK